MSLFKYVLFSFVIIISFGCTKVVKIDCKPARRDVSYENWINEFIDIDSVEINGTLFMSNDYNEIIANDSVYDKVKCISIPDKWGEYYNELCYTNSIKLGKNQNEFRFLELVIESTSNTISFGDFVVDSLTRDSELFGEFPETMKLINPKGGYTWAGIVRIKTEDNFIYFDFYIGRGGIKKIIVQYW